MILNGSAGCAPSFVMLKVLNAGAVGSTGGFGQFCSHKVGCFRCTLAVFGMSSAKPIMTRSQMYDAMYPCLTAVGLVSGVC